MRQSFIKSQAPLSAPKPSQSLIVKWITPDQIKEHKEKDLCYHYDQNYGLGYQFNTQKLYLLNVNTPKF